MNVEPRSLRQEFFAGLGDGLKVVWPILSVLLSAILAMGATVAVLEDWPLANGIYFAFVTSLMGRVVEPGKFANWIAPPAMGINRQPVDFEYIRFN